MEKCKKHNVGMQSFCSIGGATVEWCPKCREEEADGFSCPEHGKDSIVFRYGSPACGICDQRRMEKIHREDDLLAAAPFVLIAVSGFIWVIVELLTK